MTEDKLMDKHQALLGMWMQHAIAEVGVTNAVGIVSHFLGQFAIGATVDAENKEKLVNGIITLVLDSSNNYPDDVENKLDNNPRASILN